MAALRFPKIPLYQGWGHPLRVESTIDSLELLAGTPPQELNGTWYRVGPDRQFPPMHGKDVFIDGEGMAHMFRFDHGTVSYRSRWIRTARFKAQEKAGRSLFGEYRNPFDKDPAAKDIRGGTANTNAIFSAGKLLILKEDDLPYVVDPLTLETLASRFDYDGRIKADRLSGHAKIDPVSDTVLTYANQAMGDGTLDMAFYELDRQGNVLDEIWFKAPFAGHVHDFAYTERYVILPFHPLITELEAVKRTGLFYQWHPDKGMKLAVLKRGGTSADIRWFDGPAVSYGHIINAYEEGSIINYDLALSEGNWASFHFTEEGGKPSIPNPQKFRRIKIDLAKNDSAYTITSEFGMGIELARIDERWQGHPYRHIWSLVGQRPANPEAGLLGGATMNQNNASDFIDVLNGEVDIVHFDLRTGAADRYSFGPGTNVHEPQFVPRSPGSPEGDGWLLVVVNRLDQNRSELAIFNALNLAAGPTALYDIGVRLRLTFHGNWVPEETFRTHRYAMSRVPAIEN